MPSFSSHHLEVVDGVGHGHALKVVYLGHRLRMVGRILVLLCGGEDETVTCCGELLPVS